MKKIILLTLIAIGTLTNYAQTTIEHFNYGSSMDTLTNPSNGGVNWKRHSGTSGSFTSSLIYNTTSLTYPGFSSTSVGGAVEVWGVARSEDANTMVSAYTSGSVYASFLLRIDSVNSLSTVGDYFVHFGDTFGAVTLTNFKSRMFTKIGSVANTYKIGLTKSGAGSVAVFSPDYAFGTTILVVLKYKFDLSATANDSVSAYIFTSGIPTTEPTTPTLVATDVTAADYTILRSFCLRQGSLANSNFKALVDAVRVSDSWSTSVFSVNGILLTNTAIEHFSYGSTMDTLTNPSNGGVNWKRHSGTSGSFTSSLIYNTTSLTYPGYSSTSVGGAVEVWGVARSEDANRMVSAYTSGSVYASFLLRIDSVNSLSTVGDYFVHFGDTFGAVTLTNFKGRLFNKIGSVANTYKIGLTKFGAGSVGVFSPDYAFGTTVLVVLKYKFDLTATANDSVSAYIFTSGIPTTEPTTPTLVATDVTAADYTILRSFCLRQGGLANSNFKALVDAVRVSDSWSTSVLPVKFASFNAIINNKQTNLTWTTASEINNKGFEIERSLDGVSFETIGFVKGNANANRVNKYSFIDANHASAFYRLKQIDFDGKFDYSNIISVQGNDLLIDITPNPFNNVIDINSNGHLVNVEVIDITGKIVITETINGSKTSLNTASLNNGVYFVRINNGESVVTRRLIKN